MKNNRGDFLLFVLFDRNSIAKFIDVRPHPEHDEFSCYEFLKIIINNNWHDDVGLLSSGMDNYVPGSLEPKILNDKDLYTVYCAGINVLFEFDE